MRGSIKQASLSLSSFAFAIGLLALLSASVFAGPSAESIPVGAAAVDSTHAESNHEFGESGVTTFDAIEIDPLTADLYQDLSAPPPPMPVPEIPLPPMLIPLAAGFLFVSRKVLAGKLLR